MPAQHDDSSHEGKEGETGNAGQADNEPDGDAEEEICVEKYLFDGKLLVTCTLHSDRLSSPH